MPSRFDEEARVKAVRLVKDHVADYESGWAVMKVIAARWGTSVETVRKWVCQAEVGTGAAPGVPTESAREIRELKRKCAELERTIEVLNAATSFFVRECGPLYR
jgi:transposase